MIHVAFLCVFLLFLTGCQMLAPVPQVVVPETQPSPIPKVKRVEKSKSFEERLLMQAEAAYRKGYLLPPLEPNAYDRFHSVLLLDSNNSVARSGLQAILLNYADKVRRSLAVGKLAQAEQLLTDVEIYFPANPLLMDFRQDIRKQKLAMAEAAKAAAKQRNSNRSINEPQPENYIDIELDVASLSKKDEQILSVLKDVAFRLRETDESILIYARNDKEGRWIYRQLKEAVKGYRVRGDIRYSKSPKLRVLPPL